MFAVDLRLLANPIIKENERLDVALERLNWSPSNFFCEIYDQERRGLIFCMPDVFVNILGEKNGIF